MEICLLLLEGIYMALFSYLTTTDLIFKYMNKCHPNFKFTMESEINNTPDYLAILITRPPDGKLTTKVYRKPAYTGLYLRWDRFINTIKINLINLISFKLNTLMMSKIRSMVPKRDICEFTILWHHREKLGRQLIRIDSKIAPWTRLILSFKPIRKLVTRKLVI